MDRETYIVTGATGAIGRELAAELVGRGVPRVVLACRDREKAETLKSGLDATGGGRTETVFLPLDLTTSAGVRAFSAEALRRGWKVKALLNNAGTMPVGLTVCADGHELATQVNYVGTRQLTEELLPAMGVGSVVVMTSSVSRHLVRLRDDWDEHARGYRGPLRRFLTYGRSKLMITRYALELSVREAERGVRVNCSDPGVVDTPLIALGRRWAERLSRLVFRPLIRTPRQGAEAALRAMDGELTGHMYTRGGAPHPLGR